MARKDGKDRGILEKPKGSGIWWVRLFVKGREKWYRADNKSQAKTLYGRLKAEIREGIFFPEKFSQTKDVTLRSWIDRYLESSTNRNIKNERHYGRFWKLLMGKRILSQITTGDLRRIQARLKGRREKVRIYGKQTQKTGRLAPATINRRFAFLRHILPLAVKDDLLVKNPASGIKFFPEAKRTRYFSDSELDQLQKHLKPTEWDIVVFAIETGLRRNEQFSLRWDQVCFETSVITLPLPKGGRTRHVPLRKGAKAILRNLDSFLTSAWVFPSPQNPLKPRNAQSFVNKHFTPALRNAGITGACWHTLRHTAASRRIMAGVDLFAVKEILGHQDIATTMRYSHLSPGYLQDAVNQGSLIGTGSKTGSDRDEVASKNFGEESKRFD
ncbi:MAG: site-specific integrase [Nitrospira sp.]|nr:site-specific integrase [Nitrospira sp.]